MNLEEADRWLRDLVRTIPPEARQVLLELLASEDPERRAAEIGNLHASGIAPETAELLIDAEEDPYLRAVLVGMLREADR